MTKKKETQIRQAKDMTSEELGLALNELYKKASDINTSINNITAALLERQKSKES